MAVGYSHHMTLPGPQKRLVSRVHHDLRNYLVTGTTHHRFPKSPPGTATWAHAQSNMPALGLPTPITLTDMFEDMASEEGPVCPASFWPCISHARHTPPPVTSGHTATSCHTQQPRVPFQGKGSPAALSPTIICILPGLCFLLPSLTPTLPLCSCPFRPRSAPSSEVASQCPRPTCELGGRVLRIFPGSSLTPLPQAFRTSVFSIQNDDLSDFFCIQHLITSHFIHFRNSKIQIKNGLHVLRAYHMPGSVCCSNLWKHWDLVVLAQGETEAALRGYVTHPR